MIVSSLSYEMRILSLVGLLALASTALAQSTPRRLSLVLETRLDGRELKLLRDPHVVIGPHGQIVVTTRYGGTGIALFDSTGKDLGWKVPTGRRDDAEIGYPAAIGWISGTSTMWVGDPSFSQVALIDAK